jgi:soluble lytic murein transglycosylase-like protein
MNARMGMAEKLDIPQLTKAVQDGTVPSFIGIPLIQQKMKEAQQAKSMATPKAPPVAQQIMQQAEAMQAPQGIPALPSQMPEEYAQGGILSYADGGDVYDDEDYDPEDEAQAYALSQGSELMDEYLSDPNMYAPAVYEKKSAPGIESLREVKVSPSGKNFESKEAKVEVGDGTSSKLLKHILHKESRGQRYDKEGNLLTSSKGAMGEMQVMPATARDPGFGIAPARSNDPEELRRVGEEYAKVLLNKYRDPKLAAIAYNWGPGNTDKWLSAGADISRLPQETRGYIQGMAQGGIAGLAGGGAVHFAAGDVVGPFRSEADKLLAEARARAADRAAERAAERAAASAAPAAQAAAPVAAGEAAEAGRLYKLGKGVGSLARGSLPVLAGTEVAGNLGSYKFQEPNLDTSLPGVYNALKQGNYSQAGRNLMMGLPEAGMDVARGAAGLGDYLLPGQPLSSGLDKLIKDRFGSGISTPSDKVEKPYDFTEFDAATDRYMKEREKNKAPAAQTQQAKPNVYDIQDAEEGRGADAAAQAAAALKAQNAAQPTTPTEAAPAKPDYASGIEELLNKREAGLGRQKDIDTYMSLLSAGLGMMGGTSPYAAANIGQGAQAGIKTYGDAAARQAAAENSILSGRLGMYKYAGSRSQADAMMQLRREMMEKSDLRARELAGAALTEKQREANALDQRAALSHLETISKNIEAQAEKNIAGDVNKAYAPNREALKQEEVARLMRQSKAYAPQYRKAYGPEANPFEGYEPDFGSPPQGAVRKVK